MDITKMGAFIKCPACEWKISDQAHACPKCGCPRDITEMKLRQLRARLWLKEQRRWWDGIRFWWKAWWRVVISAVLIGLIALWVALFIMLV
jgi:hypothetical protein